MLLRRDKRLKPAAELLTEPKFQRLTGSARLFALHLDLWSLHAPCFTFVDRTEFS